MDIFKSFEIFLAEPLSVLTNHIIQIVGLNSGAGAKSEITVDMMKNKTQLTVFNSDKMYNILKRANSKPKKTEISQDRHQLITEMFASKPEKKKPVFGRLTLRA